MYNKDWYDSLNKSPLNPPGWTFGAVWTILYILMAISFVLVSNNKKCKGLCKPLGFFIAQLVLNLLWTTIFFRWKQVIISLYSRSFTMIKTLSLCYCGIDQGGARALFEVLIFQKSKLEELILTGNSLRNEGAKMVLNVVSNRHKMPYGCAKLGLNMVSKRQEVL